MPPMSRRSIVLGMSAPFVHACRRPGAASEIAAIEARIGGRVGVYAIDTGSGRDIAYRENERFSMASTFKWFLAAAVLERVDRGEIALDERLPIRGEDILEHAPEAKLHVEEGSMSVEALARCIITVSDNTGANLLLRRIGGPAALTAFVRRHGDAVTRLDRDEPAMNENLPGDPRDTTSPRAMVGLMRTLLLGDALSKASRGRLLDWLRACETGDRRLRAGLPEGWQVGDKTGSGSRSAINDVAIAIPPGRAPLLIATYTSDPPSGLQLKQEALASIARILARELGGATG